VPPTLDPSGNLIGVTYAGGVAYNPNATTTNGSGTFPSGSTSGYGLIYSLAPPTAGNNWAETVLRLFEGEGARTPSGPLLRGASGDYYGVTQYGGQYHSGSVFTLHKTPSGWTFQTIHSFALFDGTIRPHQDGWMPTGALVQDAAGNLYGTTLAGGNGETGVNGPDAGGVVFKLSPTLSGGWKESIIFNFGPQGGPVSGFQPIGGLTLVNGILYGMTQFGGASGRHGDGTIFSLTPPATGHTVWSFRLLWSFTGTGTDGGEPLGRLVADKAGNLYGATSLGTPSSCLCGAIFQFTPKVSPSSAH
jgi:uncharacterized repeat protein (TIGR03803 family)